MDPTFIYVFDSKSKKAIRRNANAIDQRKEVIVSEADMEPGQYTSIRCVKSARLYIYERRARTMDTVYVVIPNSYLVQRIWRRQINPQHIEVDKTEVEAYHTDMKDAEGNVIVQYRLRDIKTFFEKYAIKLLPEEQIHKTLEEEVARLPLRTYRRNDGDDSEDSNEDYDTSDTTAGTSTTRVEPSALSHGTTTMGEKVIRFMQQHVTALHQIPIDLKYKDCEGNGAWKKFRVAYWLFYCRAISIWAAFLPSQHGEDCPCCVCLRTFLPQYNRSIAQLGLREDWMKQVSYISFTLVDGAFNDKAFKTCLNSFFYIVGKALYNGFRNMNFKAVGLSFTPDGPSVFIDHTYLTPVGSTDTELQPTVKYYSWPDSYMTEIPNTGFPTHNVADDKNKNYDFYISSRPRLVMNDSKKVMEIVDYREDIAIPLEDYDNVPKAFQGLLLIICQKMLSTTSRAVDFLHHEERMSQQARFKAYQNFIAHVESSRYKYVLENVKNLRYPFTNLHLKPIATPKPKTSRDFDRFASTCKRTTAGQARKEVANLRGKNLADEEDGWDEW